MLAKRALSVYAELQNLDGSPRAVLLMGLNCLVEGACKNFFRGRGSV